MGKGLCANPRHTPPTAAAGRPACLPAAPAEPSSLSSAAFLLALLPLAGCLVPLAGCLLPLAGCLGARFGVACAACHSSVTSRGWSPTSPCCAWLGQPAQLPLLWEEGCGCML